MGSAGMGLRLRAGLPHSAAVGPSSVAEICRRYLFGVGPAPVTQIPYRWLARPLGYRADPIINDQRVTQRGGTEARRTNAGSQALDGAAAGSDIELDTACADDPASLAAMQVAYYAEPRERAPRFTIDLLDGTKLVDDDRLLLLSVKQGDRVLITDSPATWPPGLERGEVRGIRREHTGHQLLLTLTCVPLIGAVAGEVGPWWRLDSTPLDADTSRIPF